MLEKYREKLIAKELDYIEEYKKQYGELPDFLKDKELKEYCTSKIDSIIESAKNRVQKAFDDKNKKELVKICENNNNVASRYFLSKLADIDLPLDKNQKGWIEKINNINF